VGILFLKGWQFRFLETLVLDGCVRGASLEQSALQGSCLDDTLPVGLGPADEQQE